MLGNHAQQQGSKVDDDWLRFDFTNLTGLTDQQVQQIESLVTERVQASQPISWKTVALSEARTAGAMMLFGEKYPDPVRMVSIGDFSKELCGGTHLSNTAEVVSFEVSSEGIAAGTRIEALTGEGRRTTRSGQLASTSVCHRMPQGTSLAVKALSPNPRAAVQLDGGAGIHRNHRPRWPAIRLFEAEATARVLRGC